MRSPSARVLINTVDIYLNVAGPDNEGGPDFTFPSTPNFSKVPCTVQPTGTETVDSQNRLTQIDFYNVIFGFVPNLSARDLMIWVDALGITHKLFVQNDTDMAGRGAAYMVTAVERS